MKGFSDLPNEIVVQVWRSVLQPEDVQNFALTTKGIMALGRAFIEEHNRLKARFSSILNFQSRMDPADMLKTLLLNPRATLYVRNISIDAWGLRITKTPGYGPDTMELIKQVIKESPFILEEEVEEWAGKVERGNEEILSSLILLLLPNVHALSLLLDNSFESRLSNMVQRIAQSQDTEALSRLTEVEVWVENVIPRDDARIQGFSALPSVKKVENLNYNSPRFKDNDDDNDTFEERYFPDAADYSDSALRFTLPPETSAQLTIGDSVIKPLRLSERLQGMRALEIFDYLSTHEYMDFSVFPGLSRVVSDLMAYAKHSLQTLRIRTCGRYKSCTVNLTGFEVLKELEIESDFLLPYKDAPRTKKLAYWLLLSLEGLHLHRVFTKVAHSIENDVIQISKAERLPNLKEVWVELVSSDDAPKAKAITELKQKCEDVGVVLSVTTSSQARPRTDAMGRRW